MLNRINSQLRWKVTLSLVTLIITVMAAVTYYDYQAQRQLWFDNLAENIRQEAAIIRGAISLSDSPAELQEIVTAIGETVNLSLMSEDVPVEDEHQMDAENGAESMSDAEYEIFILDDQSIVLASNLPGIQGETMDLSMTAPVLQVGAEFDTGVMSHMGHKSFFGTLALYDEDTVPANIVGAVHLSQPMTALENNLSSFLRQRLISVSISALLLILVVGIAATRLIVNPIVKLTAGAKKVMEGDLNTFTDIERSDEIGSLAATFNNMAKKLKK